MLKQLESSLINSVPQKLFFNSLLLNSIIQWAITPFQNGLTDKNIKRTETKTISQIRDEARNEEKTWGNTMIGQVSNGNWTTLLGENLVHDVLVLLGEHPRRPKRMDGYQPDWETDNYIYEVKTRNWTTSGTAGEKVYGVPYKYSEIPNLYGKPLRIVCVGYQEWELANGTTRIFGDVPDNKRMMLDWWESIGISYVKFSDLVSKLDYNSL